MLRHIAKAAFREQPWKNGGGLTYEIAADDFTPPSWRVSIARISRGGPFSDYLGYDRTILALDGARVTLEVNRKSIDLEPHVPFQFPGEAMVLARVSGIARDLNVITARDEWVHDVEIVDKRTRFVLEEEEFAIVYAIAGSVNVENERCESGDAMWISECESFGVEPEPDATICVIRITPL